MGSCLLASSGRSIGSCLPFSTGGRKTSVLEGGWMVDGNFGPLLSLLSAKVAIYI